MSIQLVISLSEKDFQELQRQVHESKQPGKNIHAYCLEIVQSFLAARRLARFNDPNVYQRVGAKGGSTQFAQRKPGAALPGHKTFESILNRDSRITQ